MQEVYAYDEASLGLSATAELLVIHIADRRLQPYNLLSNDKLVMDSNVDERRAAISVKLQRQFGAEGWEF